LEGRSIKVNLGNYAKSGIFKQWLKGIYIAVALIIIAFLFHVADSIITSTVDPLWLKSLYLIGMTFVLGTIIWFLAFVPPKVFQVVFQMIGANDFVEEKSSKENVPFKKEIHKQGNKPNIGITQKTFQEEESESEKLRREFKNRKL
jgi:hypothetical protein